MNYSNIFDTHSHYDDSAFDEDRATIFEYLKNNGVSNIINCGCDLKSSLTAVEFATNNDFVFAAVGIHPENVEETEKDELIKITELYSNEKVVAIGEIGLDYHWDTDRTLQNEIFEKQLQLSKEYDLPVIIHDREAHEDTLNLLKKYKPTGVLHCFSGSVETAKEILKLGMYIGLGGAVTFKNAKKAVAVAQMLPADRILLETDCPYMAPVPFRGKRCDSAMIASTAEFIAGLRQTETQEFINQCTENSKKLFLKK